MQDRDIARSITEIFLASKIIKAVENVIARKESALLIDSDNILLEDYLFDSYENNYVNKPIFKNIMFVDSYGRVLNISGSLFVTEAETMELANGTTVRTPTVNMESTNEVASSFISMPSSVDITGTLSNVKDITIEKVGNTYNVIDTQTQEIIATVKTSVAPALKDFAASIVAATKSLFGSIVNDPLPYAIGFLGGAILLPVLNKVIGFLRNRKQNKQNSQSASGENVGGESYFIDDIDQLVFEESEESNKNNILRRIFDKIMAVLKTIYRKGVNFIKAVASYIVSIFNKSKVLAQRSLRVIREMFLKARFMTVQYTLYIVEQIIKYTKFVAAKIQQTSKTIYNKIKAIITALDDKLDRAARKVVEKLDRNYELAGYLESIKEEIEMLRGNLRTILKKQTTTGNVEKAFTEIAINAEKSFNRIFELLSAFLTKLKKRSTEIIQALSVDAVRTLAVLDELLVSFIKTLGRFANKIKTIVSDWVDKIIRAIMDEPMFEKIKNQLLSIKKHTL